MGLAEKLTQFESRYQENPDTGEDKYSAFLRELSRTGELKTFSEADWNALGEREGLSTGELADLVEQAASWLTTGDEDKSIDWDSDPIHSGSAREVSALVAPSLETLTGGGSQENPESEEEEDDEDDCCEGCVEDCDCEDDDEECVCESCETCEEAHKDDEEELDYCTCCCDCTEEDVEEVPDQQE